MTGPVVLAPVNEILPIVGVTESWLALLLAFSALDPYQLSSI